MTFQGVLEQLKAIVSAMAPHKEAIGLFLLAAIVTMRPQLPWPFNRIEALEWAWEWLRDALLTFVSLRGPARSEALLQTDKSVVTDAAGKKTETSSSTAKESSAAPEVKS